MEATTRDNIMSAKCITGTAENVTSVAVVGLVTVHLLTTGCYACQITSNPCFWHQKSTEEEVMPFIVITVHTTTPYYIV